MKKQTRPPFFLYLVALLSLTSISESVLAQTLYVTDSLGILMRRGESIEHAITKNIPSGTRLTVVSQNPETGYSLVTTPDGTEGYVLSRFLMETPAARSRLKSTMRKLEKLNEENSILSTENKTLRDRTNQLSHLKDELETKNTDYADKLKALEELAAKPIAIYNDNKLLVQQNKQLNKRIDSLVEAQKLSRHDQNIKWFIVGSVVAISCLILGLVIPRLNLQRRQSWGY